MAQDANGAVEAGESGPEREVQHVKIVVTGGMGFVGSAIVRALQEFHPDWDIWILDRIDDRDSELLKGCKYNFMQADITDESGIATALALVQPDAVIHTAGTVPVLSERYARRLQSLITSINVQGTRHVVEAARKIGCRAFVYTSSCCAVTDDMSQPYANIDERWPVAERSSMYGESKAEAERIVLAANTESMPTCALRPSVIFGEGDNQLVPPIHACIAKGETRWIIGSGTNLWDVSYVGNIADAHVLAVENLLRWHGDKSRHESAAGEIFFIQNNEPISFRDFTLAVWREFGHYPPAWEIRIPESLGWVLGLVAEVFTRIFGTPTTLSRGSVMDACAMRYASGDKAARVLGYHARVGLEAGVKRSCQEYARRLTKRRP